MKRNSSEIGYRVSEAGGAMAILTYPFSVSLSQIGLFFAIVGWVVHSLGNRLHRVHVPANPVEQTGARIDPTVMQTSRTLSLQLHPVLLAAFSIYLAELFSQLVGASASSHPVRFVVRGLGDEIKDVLLVFMALWVVSYAAVEERKKRAYRWLEFSAHLLVWTGFVSIFSKFRLSKIPYHMTHGWVDSEAARYQHYLFDVLQNTALQIHLYMPIGMSSTHLTYAAQLGMVFPFLFFRLADRLMENPRNFFKPRILLRIAELFAAVVVLLLNNGRSAILGLGAALLIGIYYFIRIYWKKRTIYLFSVLVLLGIFTGGAALVSRSFRSKLDKVMDPIVGKSKHTDYQRDFLWHAASSLAEENPYFGIGAGTFQASIEERTLAFSKANPELWYAYETIQRGHAHNDLLHLLVIGGVIPVLFYLLFFAVLLATILKRSSTQWEDYWKWGVLLILWGGLYQCYFQVDEVLLPFWILVGLSLRGVMDARNPTQPGGFFFLWTKMKIIS